MLTRCGLAFVRYLHCLKSIDDGVPFATGFEEEFGEFAGGAAAPGFLGDDVGGGLEFGGGIGDGDVQAAAVEDHEVGKVVAHGCDRVFVDTETPLQDVNALTLVADLLKDVSDAEFFCASSDGFGAATGDDGDLDARHFEQGDAETIGDVEALDVIGGTEPDRAFGERAIDIEDEELDGGEALVHGCRGFAPGRSRL